VPQFSPQLKTGRVAATHGPPLVDSQLSI